MEIFSKLAKIARTHNNNTQLEMKAGLLIMERMLNVAQIKDCICSYANEKRAMAKNSLVLEC